MMSIDLLKHWLMEVDTNPVLLSCIVFCNYVGRVDVLMKSIDLLEHWLMKVDTNPVLLSCIVEYAQDRGGITMFEICQGKAYCFCLMAADQDDIGWRRFVEGMVCHCI